MTARARVTTTSPLAVRVAGDAFDTTIGMIDAEYSPTVGDDVVLLKVGTQWMLLRPFMVAS